jgi:hypothetical protein
MLGLGAVNVLFVPLMTRVLVVSPAWFGPLDMAQSASMILAAGMIGAIAARIRRRRSSRSASSAWRSSSP